MTLPGQEVACVFSDDVVNPKVGLRAVVGKDHGLLSPEFLRVQAFVEFRLQESPRLFGPEFLST